MILVDVSYLAYINQIHCGKIKKSIGILLPTYPNIGDILH